MFWSDSAPSRLHAVYVAVCDDDQKKEANAQNIVGLVELTVAPCPVCDPSHVECAKLPLKQTSF